MAPTTRKSYDAEFKLNILAFAKENGNRATKRKFNVSEKIVHDWRKKEDKLRSTKTNKKGNRSGKASWPVLEKNLRKWIVELRAAGHGLSTIQIRLKAKSMAKESEINDFGGGPSWCFRFMRRHQLSIRARTTMSQPLPDDFVEKLENFSIYVSTAIDEHVVHADHLINMDEVPLTFDIPTSRRKKKQCLSWTVCKPT